MAIEATFTGWLNDIKEFDWGTVLKMSHSVRRKDEQGEWQTVGKDYIDVIVDPAKRGEFSDILNAQVPSRVAVTGNCKPHHYTNQNGETVNLLKVWPNAMELETGDYKAQPEGQEYIDTPF